MKKSLWTRLLSLLLAVVLCVELLPAVGSAVSPSEDLEHTVEGTVEEPAEVAFEEASLRSERVKHFRMGDGSYVAVQYDVPVHHQDADGQWQDIDNTLEPVGQTYAVEDGSVAFAASLNGDAVFTAGADEHRVQLFLDGDPDVLPSHDATLEAPEPTEAVALPEVTEETAEEPAEETETAASEEEPAAEMMVETGAAAELEPAGPARSYHAAEAVVQEPFSLRSDDPFVPEKLSSSLLYPDVYDGVDLAYTLYGETIKETILVNKAQASYLFSFVLQTGDLTAEMQEDGSVLLLDEAGSPVYAIPAPYMLDAGGRTPTPCATASRSWTAAATACSSTRTPRGSRKRRSSRSPSTRRSSRFRSPAPSHGPMSSPVGRTPASPKARCGSAIPSITAAANIRPSRRSTSCLNCPPAAWSRRLPSMHYSPASATSLPTISSTCTPTS